MARKSKNEIGRVYVDTFTSDKYLHMISIIQS